MERARARNQFDCRCHPRCGMTLLELLIVVSVMVILMGIALPMMKTGIEGRKLREAARQVNTTVELAKALAAESGRYAGVILDAEALPEDTSMLFARRIYLAEAPPPYAGDVAGATARIFIDGSSGTDRLRARFNLDGLSVNLGPLLVSPGADGRWGVAGVDDDGNGVVDDIRDMLWPGSDDMVKVGSLIRFDHRNPMYLVTNVTPDRTTNPMTYIVDLEGSPWPADGVLLTYQLTRPPEKSSFSPFELPSGAVIDFSSSGFGSNDTQLATLSGPVTVVFGPSGRMVGVLGIVPPLTAPPLETLHVLIGTLENLGTANLADPSTLWVSIGHHVGRVTTAESGVSPGAVTLQDAREYAQSGQAIGGR